MRSSLGDQSNCLDRTYLDFGTVLGSAPHDTSIYKGTVQVSKAPVKQIKELAERSPDAALHRDPPGAARAALQRRAAKPALSFFIGHWERNINSLLQNLWNGKVYQSDKSEGKRDRGIAACLPLEECVSTLNTWGTARDAQDARQACPHQPQTQLQDQSKRLPPLTAGSHSSGTEHTGALPSCGLLVFATAPKTGRGTLQAQNKSSSPRADSPSAHCQTPAQPTKARWPR